MLNVRIEFVSSLGEKDFNSAFENVLSKLACFNRVLKTSVFFDTVSDKDYESKFTYMEKQIVNRFGDKFPSVSYIAQKPLSGLIAAEIVLLEGVEEIQYKKHLDFSYSIVKKPNRKAIFLSGLRSNSVESVFSQSNAIFLKIEEILKNEGMRLESIVRQWNYIPEITGFDNELQHYQQFNDSRTLFYQKTRWPNGYPAATGIGTQTGPLLIDLIAMQGHNDEFAIKNPRQIDAHVYSEEVLIGEKELHVTQKSTPKFERAKLISDQKYSMVFVSGTAAIIGEESISINDVGMQTHLTLENIERLVDQKNLQTHKEFSTSRFVAMRVYIKREADFKNVKRICQEKYPSVPFIFLLSDVCRKELLVEIEAFVQCA